jgi:hypothetical protein
MDFILIAIVIVSLYLAITLVGFSRVAASVTAPFDTRFIRPVKFINNSNLSYEIEVDPPETSLAMMRGLRVDEDNNALSPGTEDIQIGDLVKVKKTQRTYEPALCGQPEHANEIEYYGRVIGVDGEKAKIQWTYYKVKNYEDTTCASSQSFENCARTDSNCCRGKRQCHLSKAEDIREVKKLFGTADMSCSDCPVSSKVLIDQLVKVSEIPNESTDKYINEQWLSEMNTSGDNLLNENSSTQTEYNLF